MESALFLEFDGAMKRNITFEPYFHGFQGRFPCTKRGLITEKSWISIWCIHDLLCWMDGVLSLLHTLA